MDAIITENTILEHENKLYNAIKESDITTLNELLHEDLLFIIPSGEVITKEMDLKAYKERALKVAELYPQVENLNIIGDLAIITLTMGLKGEFNDEPFEANYRYIRFWKKFVGGLKVVGGSGIGI